MAENEHPDYSDQESMREGSAPGEVPIEEEALAAPEHPRRAASAEFVVRAETGSASVLREAMDPANQSLAEALKLSYRVLQVVIVILLLLFLFSGFRNIENNQTGVKTLFGKITGGETADEEAALRPGLAVSFWPYPAAEFHIFNQSNAVAVGEPFWPDNQIGGIPNFDEAAKGTRATEAMRFGLGSGRDGYVLIEDGLAHLQLQATYAINNPVRFAEEIMDERKARQIVRYALQRGTVHAMAKMRLDDALDQEEVVAARIRDHAQELLHDLNTGIDLVQVQATDVRPPLAIVNTMRGLSNAIANAQQLEATARQERNSELVRTAGENYERVLTLIDQYERAILQSEQGVRSEEAQSILREIDLALQSEDVAGGVSETLARARAYKDEIQSTIGAHAKRFAGLLAAYRENPEFVVTHQWVETYRRILSRPDAEVIQFPPGLASMRIHGTSRQDAMLAKRLRSQEVRRQKAIEEAGFDQPYRFQMGERDITRRLGITEEGTVRGRGQDNQN